MLKVNVFTEGRFELEKFPLSLAHAMDPSKLEEAFKKKLRSCFPNMDKYMLSVENNVVFLQFMNYRVSASLDGFHNTREFLFAKATEMVDSLYEASKRRITAKHQKRQSEFQDSCARQQINKSQAASVEDKVLFMKEEKESFKKFKNRSVITSQSPSQARCDDLYVISEKTRQRTPLVYPHESVSANNSLDSFPADLHDLSEASTSRHTANSGAGRSFVTRLYSPKGLIDVPESLITESFTARDSLSVPSFSSMKAPHSSRDISSPSLNGFTGASKPTMVTNESKSDSVHKATQNNDGFCLTRQHSARHNIADLSTGDDAPNTHNPLQKLASHKNTLWRSSLTELPNVDASCDISVERQGENLPREGSDDPSRKPTPDTSYMKKIIADNQGQAYGFIATVRGFCIHYKVASPEFEIIRENDVFRCTAIFLEINFVSSYEYDKLDAKNNSCKKIVEYIVQNWESIFRDD